MSTKRGRFLFLEHWTLERGKKEKKKTTKRRKADGYEQQNRQNWRAYTPTHTRVRTRRSFQNRTHWKLTKADGKRCRYIRTSLFRRPLFRSLFRSLSNLIRVFLSSLSSSLILPVSNHSWDIWDYIDNYSKRVDKTKQTPLFHFIFYDIQDMHMTQWWLPFSDSALSVRIFVAHLWIFFFFFFFFGLSTGIWLLQPSEHRKRNRAEPKSQLMTDIAPLLPYKRCNRTHKPGHLHS